MELFAKIVNDQKPFTIFAKKNSTFGKILNTPLSRSIGNIDLDRGVLSL